MNRFVLFTACGLAIQTASSAFTGAQTTTTAGLDSLTDDRLMSDLATRGQSGLLDHAMDVNHVAATERNAMRSLLALRQLNDPKVHLSPSQREAMARQVAAGIEATLPTLNDPQTLMQQATALLSAGVERDANTLEYWGDNAATQTAMRPVVEAVVQLLDKATTEAKKQADAVANTIASPDDPKAKKWEALSNVVTAAAYTRHMVDYYHCLSLDRADPQRKDVAGKAIEFLAQYDNADSNVQAAVRLRIAKLHMMRSEYELAQGVFATVSATPAKEISPAPDASQQWEARYFSAVCDLLSGSVPAAQKSLDAVILWQTQNLAKDKSTQDGAAAATSMLQYRVDATEAQTAQTDDVKKAANDKAVAVLMDLVKKRPDLQSIIFQQLMSKMPADTNLKTLEPLMLQGYIAAADQERLKPDDQPADQKIIQRGLDAVAEMLSRKDVDPQLTDTATLLRGFFLLRLGQKIDAANAFLDYAQSAGQSQTNHVQANLDTALDNATAVIANLRTNPATAETPETTKAYERFLQIAIEPPFSRVEFAFEYARRLQLNGKLAAAVEAYRKVPIADKRYPAARFYQMATLGQRLDEEKLSAPERSQTVDEIVSLVDDAASRISAGINAAKDDREKSQYRSMLAGTVLLAADVARREQNDPKRAITLLQNFEQDTAGLSNEKELLGHALYTRVQAYMASGDSDSATQALVALLKTRGGSEGASIVYKLMQKLSDELDQARRNTDVPRMRQLAQNRAQLSGFLVEWARSNADANIRKYTYRYSVVDASTKKLAADLEADPTKQNKAWADTLKLYQQLESPVSVELYKATLDAKSPDANYPDPAVSLGVGLLSYDLGDFAEAQKRLGRLLVDRKLGTPVNAVEENGQTKLQENDQYWEATLDLMRSNVALAAAHSDDATAQAAKTETTSYLKQLYVRYGRDVGGSKWAAQFEALRKQIAPDLNPDDFTVQTTQPTTTRP